MPVSTKLYRISVKFEPSKYNLKEIGEAITGWKDEKKIPRESDEDLILKRNFTEPTLSSDGLLWGIYQIDIPVATKERDGPIRIVPTFEEFNFFIKPNGKILFFGSKSRGGYFCSDLSRCLSERVPSNHVFYDRGDDLCKEHSIPEKVMLHCARTSPETQEVSAAAFKGNISIYITKKDIGGINLRSSPEVVDLMKRSDVTLHRLIFKLMLGNNIMTLQITGDGLILGYFNKDRFPLSIMKDILGFLEYCASEEEEVF